MEPLLRTRRLSCPTHSKNNGVGLSIRNDVYMVCKYIYIYIDIYNTPYVSLYFYPKEKKGVDSFCPIRSFHTRLRFLFAPAWQCLLPRTLGWTKSKSASGGTNAPGSWDGYTLRRTSLMMESVFWEILQLCFLSQKIETLYALHMQQHRVY